MPTTTRRRVAMANEAYRAVFLRVHPTGKMVLSLTTESDGKEARVRAARRRRARRPARSTSRSFPRTPTGSASATATTRARPTGTSAAIVSATGKIRAKAQLLAGVALGRAAGDARRGSNGAWVGGDGSDPDAGQDDRGHRALRARHRRPAARRRGRARRADRLPRLSRGRQARRRARPRPRRRPSARRTAPSRA